MKIDFYDLFLFVVCVALLFILTLSNSNKTQAASAITSQQVESYDIPEEVERLSKTLTTQPTQPTQPTRSVGMKYPVLVQYTGAGSGEESQTTLKTWIITDKLTGARVLVVQYAGSDQVACTNLPP